VPVQHSWSPTAAADDSATGTYLQGCEFILYPDRNRNVDVSGHHGHTTVNRSSTCKHKNNAPVRFPFTAHGFYQRLEIDGIPCKNVQLLANVQGDPVANFQDGIHAVMDKWYNQWTHTGVRDHSATRTQCWASNTVARTPAYLPTPSLMDWSVAVLDRLRVPSGNMWTQSPWLNFAMTSSIMGWYTPFPLSMGRTCSDDNPVNSRTQLERQVQSPTRP
jgi:hypothetical protein